MKENYMVCNCMQVSYVSIADGVHAHTELTDVVKVFEEVQKQTHCSTGCGGCHDKVMKIISDIVMGESIA